MNAEVIRGITVRPLRNGETTVVQAVFDRLGPRSRLLRFGGAKNVLTERDIAEAEVVIAEISAGGICGRGECTPYARYGETGSQHSHTGLTTDLDLTRAGRPRRRGRQHGGRQQTFEAQGVAHLVTAPDGVTPPVGAWLYYRDATNPAGHVVTYLGNGKIASTDVFGRGRVGIGPASAITDGPWHMQYLGWAPPWGRS